MDPAFALLDKVMMWPANLSFLVRLAASDFDTDHYIQVIDLKIEVTRAGSGSDSFGSRCWMIVRMLDRLGVEVRTAGEFNFVDVVVIFLFHSIWEIITCQFSCILMLIGTSIPVAVSKDLYLMGHCGKPT